MSEFHSGEHSVGDLLREGVEQLSATSPSPRLDAELLLGDVLGFGREALIVNSQSEVDSVHKARFFEKLERRREGVPIAYLTGVKEFFGLTFKVDRRVLIPRPETELLVELGLDHLSRSRKRVRVLDLGTGSGCLVVSLAHKAKERCTSGAFLGVDRSVPALRVARSNAVAHGVSDKVQFLCADWVSAFRLGRFDLIVSNPPYVEPNDSEQSPELRWEPSEALYGGPNGLAAYRSLLPGAIDLLAEGGALLLEIGATQADAVKSLATPRKSLLQAVETHQDLAGRDRVVAFLRGREGAS